MNRYGLFLSGKMKAGQLGRLTERDRLSLINVIHGFEIAHHELVDKHVRERFQLMRRFENLVTLTPKELERKFRCKSNDQLRRELYELESGEPG